MNNTTTIPQEEPTLMEKIVELEYFAGVNEGGMYYQRVPNGFIVWAMGQGEREEITDAGVYIPFDFELDREATMHFNKYGK